MASDRQQDGFVLRMFRSPSRSRYGDFKPVLEAFLLFEAGMDGSDFVDAVSGPDLRISSLGRPICCSECQIDILYTLLTSCSSRLVLLLVCYP